MKYKKGDEGGMVDYSPTNSLNHSLRSGTPGTHKQPYVNHGRPGYISRNESFNSHSQAPRPPSRNPSYVYATPNSIKRTQSINSQQMPPSVSRQQSFSNAPSEDDYYNQKYYPDTDSDHSRKPFSYTNNGNTTYVPMYSKNTSNRQGRY